MRLSAQKDLEGLFSRVSFGLNLTQRDKTKGSAETLPAPARWQPLGRRPARQRRRTWRLPGVGLNTISFRPARRLPQLLCAWTPNVNGDILRKGWEVNEDIQTFFVKGDIDTELFGMPVRGNIGVQFVQTEAEVDGASRGQHQPGASSRCAPPARATTTCCRP
jgi:iron complex outermembrane recepter protein